jgi:hypothetical protein
LFLLPVPLAGEGIGGQGPPFAKKNADAEHRPWRGSFDRLGLAVRCPHPPRSAERVDLPRKRER